VESQSNVTLKSRVEGTTTIIWIIPEGTLVQPPVASQIDGEVVAIRDEGKKKKTILVRGSDGKTVAHPVKMGEYTVVLVKKGDQVTAGQYLAGDLCVQLDSSELEEREKQQQISVTRAKADLEKAQKDVELKRTQMESEIASAQLAYELAQLDLENYTSGEYQQQVDEIKGRILVAQQELNQALEDYEFVKRVAKKGYKSQKELETARIAVVKAQNTLETEKGRLRVLEEFTYKRTLKEYTENAAEAKRQLERARLRRDAEMAQVVAEFEARKLMYQLELDKLKRYQQQIEACRMIAPQAGQVVYANQTYRRSQPEVIEAGTVVRENQEIIKLPDFSQMKVDARIHESKISDLRPGLPALIRIDAFPDRVFHGVVDTVSSVPLPGRWPNFDLKEYEASIRITDDTTQIEQLKPGLTANVEIIIDQREGVLQVPVQAIVTVGDLHFAYVLTEKGPERRRIKIGDTNDTHMEILDGLTEGEEVILNPRTKFAAEIAELEAKFGKPKEEKVPAVPPGKPGKVGGHAGPTVPGKAGRAARPPRKGVGAAGGPRPGAAGPGRAGRGGRKGPQGARIPRAKKRGPAPGVGPAGGRPKSKPGHPARRGGGNAA